MRQLESGDPGPAFNLARNWAHWGQAGPAGVGAVVVWSHHVGKIVGLEDGAWIINPAMTATASAPGRARSPAPSPFAGDDRIPGRTLR